MPVNVFFLFPEDTYGTSAQHSVACEVKGLIYLSIEKHDPIFGILVSFRPHGKQGNFQKSI